MKRKTVVFTGSIQFPGLFWDIRGRKQQPFIQVPCRSIVQLPVHQLRNNLAIPRLVKLIDHNTVKLGQVLDDPHHDLQERIEIRGATELVVDLGHDGEDVHHADVW